MTALFILIGLAFLAIGLRMLWGSRLRWRAHQRWQHLFLLAIIYVIVGVVVLYAVTSSL